MWLPVTSMPAMDRPEGRIAGLAAPALGWGCGSGSAVAAPLDPRPKRRRLEAAREVYAFGDKEDTQQARDHSDDRLD
jgi:hypothetical protein